MRDALNATGRPVVFSLCGWNTWYAPVGTDLGNLWRISGDVTNFASMINALNLNAPLAIDAGPGGWNDPVITTKTTQTCR
jgi:alpha-galactosidase